VTTNKRVPDGLNAGRAEVTGLETKGTGENARAPARPAAVDARGYSRRQPGKDNEKKMNELNSPYGRSKKQRGAIIRAAMIPPSPDSR